jgi:hypothetical protein
LYAAKNLIGTKICAKLDVILALNGLPTKTSNGMEAVHMAREGRWEELREYCLSDTILTRNLMLSDPVFWVENLKYAPLTRCVWV